METSCIIPLEYVITQLKQCVFPGSMNESSIYPFRNQVYTINKQQTAEIIEEKYDDCGDYPGDSLPHPKVTVDELDAEMDEYWNNNIS